MELTKKQKAFTQEYLIDLNGSAAARRAGYSAKSADKISHQLLNNLKIQAEINWLIKERSERTKITADMVIKELSFIAFSNIGNYLGWSSNEVTLFDSKTIAPHQLAAVKSLKLGQGKTSIQFYDKIEALKILGEHLGMFRDVSTDENRSKEARAAVIDRISNYLAARSKRDNSQT